MNRIATYVTGIAAAITLTWMLAGAAAAAPHGVWTGSWTPGHSCRDSIEREMKAWVGDYGFSASIRHKQRGNGAFRAEFRRDGRFETRAIGPNQLGIQVRGQIVPGMITGSWTARFGCTGSFTLYPPVL